MAFVELYNPTGRNTKAAVVTVGDREFFFSYRTCIAYRGSDVDKFIQARIANSWGPTTGRHFKELGCSEFPIYTDDEFQKLLERVSF